MRVETFTIPLGFDHCSVLKSDGDVPVNAGQPEKGAIFADETSAVVASWKKLIKLGAPTVFPAQGSPFPVSVIERAISRQR